MFQSHLLIQHTCSYLTVVTYLRTSDLNINIGKHCLNIMSDNTGYEGYCIPSTHG